MITGATQHFTLSGSSQASTAFGAGTYQVRIATGAQPAYFQVGATPVATTNTSMVLGINLVDYVPVRPGQKIAVLEAGSAGGFTVTEMV